MKEFYLHTNPPGEGYEFTYFLSHNKTSEPYSGVYEKGKMVTSVQPFIDGFTGMVCAWVKVEGEEEEYKAFAQGVVDDPEYADEDY